MDPTPRIFQVISSQLLLWEAMAPVWYLAKKATINCSPHGLTLIASDQDWTVVMVLEIERTKFNRFSCCQCFSFSVNLEEFNKMLRQPINDGIITIFGGDEAVVIGFSQGLYFGSHAHIHCETALTEVDIRRLIVVATEYKYNVSVGIRSKPFRTAIGYLIRATQVPVSVTITSSQVRFSATTEAKMNDRVQIRSYIKIIDTPGEFVISTRPDPLAPVKLKFSLRRILSYLRASTMAEAVWLFDSVDSGTMIFCPSSHGDFMYFFPTQSPPN